jgi:hypothetical protein
MKLQPEGCAFGRCAILGLISKGDMGDWMRWEMWRVSDQGWDGEKSFWFGDTHDDMR